MTKRIEWRPWNWSTKVWIVTSICLLAISPVISRWFCLFQIPDVQLPFQPDDLIHPPLPKELDAFTHYTKALTEYGKNQNPNFNNQYLQAIQDGCPHWDQDFENWLIIQSKALALFIDASEIPQADGPPIADATYSTRLPVHNDLRQLTALARLEAIRLQNRGKSEDAWKYLRAIHRTGIHADQPGFFICALTGSTIRINGLHAMESWAADPNLSVERLERAEAEIQLENRSRLPVSSYLKIEYYLFRNSLNHVDGVDYIQPAFTGVGPAQGPVRGLKRLMLWSLGEPELRLRLARQMVVNEITEIDKPLAQRSPMIRDISIGQYVFEIDPTTTRASGQINATSLNRLLDRYKWFDRNLILIGLGHVDQSRMEEDARLSLISVLFASHRFQRQHGEFPPDLDTLVPDYLPSKPIDLLSKEGATVRYRRNSKDDAIAWSVGRNQVDDEGKSEPKQEELDIIVRIRLLPQPQSTTPNE